jgi:hypothetical protein
VWYMHPARTLEEGFVGNESYRPSSLAILRMQGELHPSMYGRFLLHKHRRRGRLFTHGANGEKEGTWGLRWTRGRAYMEWIRMSEKEQETPS